MNEFINNQVYQVILTDENFTAEVLEHNSLVFVEFSADWCGASHIIAPITEKLADKYKRKIKFAKLDIDKNKKTTAQFGITEIPVLLIFQNGHLCDHISGVFSCNELESKIQLLLQ